jgi:hypothetical protein
VEILEVNRVETQINRAENFESVSLIRRKLVLKFAKGFSRVLVIDNSEAEG